MATPTYDLIASSVLTSAASSVTFSSISQDYRDLILVVAGEIPSGFAPDILVNLNADTNNANYSVVNMGGTGSSTFSLTNAPRRVGLAEGVSSAIIQIMDYSATDKHKTFLTRANTSGSSFGVGATANRWANTSAVTSIEIAAGTAPTSSFQAGTIYQLYGIAA